MNNMYFVSPNGKKGWKVKGAGNTKASNTFSTKKEAIEKGIELAKKK